MTLRTWTLAILATMSFASGEISAQDTAKAGESAGKWKTEKFTMSGKSVAVAVSAYVSAVVRPEEMPRARVTVACDSVWIRFTAYPDLSRNTFVRPFAYRIDRGIVFSSIIPYHRDTHQAQYELQLGRDRDLVAGLVSGSEFGIVLQWYGGRAIPFSWPLKGSTAAIRASCRDS